MTAAKPKLWISNKHTNFISHRKLTGYESKYPKTFEISHRIHASWNEAHAAVLAHREREVKEAEHRLLLARRALERAQKMKAPE